MVVTSFQGMASSFKGIHTHFATKCVTHVSERVLPICPVYTTLGEGQTLAERQGEGSIGKILKFFRHSERP